MVFATGESGEEMFLFFTACSLLNNHEQTPNR